jgi:hypothetical protein
MSDEVLRKYISRNGAPGGDPDGDTDAEGAEDLGAFGWMRSQRDRCTMIELRKKDGSIVAIGYGWIERVEFDPSEGITLHAHGKKLRIRGRNLNGEARPHMRLFQGLTCHRVPWVQEAGQSLALIADKQAPVVESIEW